MPATLLLDRETWDLCVGLDGNIAKAGEPYSQAQDAASAIKLFQGELYYLTNSGVPYFSQILGRAPPVSLMKAKWQAAALTVSGVVTARCFIASITERRVTGQVQIITAAGKISAASF